MPMFIDLSLLPSNVLYTIPEWRNVKHGQTYPVFPSMVARCNGVLPCLSFLSNLAPFSNKNSQAARDPYNVF